MINQEFTFLAVLFPDLQRTSFGGTDEEALLHVRTTRLSHLRGANQVQRIHEAVLLLTLDRGNCLSLDLELLIACVSWFPHIKTRSYTDLRNQHRNTTFCYKYINNSWMNKSFTFIKKYSWKIKFVKQKFKSIQ